jgi:F0F1-type ATP synthase gamma subunit
MILPERPNSFQEIVNGTTSPHCLISTIQNQADKGHQHGISRELCEIASAADTL